MEAFQCRFNFLTLRRANCINLSFASRFGDLASAECSAPKGAGQNHWLKSAEIELLDGIQNRADCHDILLFSARVLVAQLNRLSLLIVTTFQTFLYEFSTLD